MKLYEITHELSQAIELYNQVESDEDLVKLEAMLNDLQNSFDDKAVGVAKFVLNVESDLPALDGEIKRLSALKKRVEAKAKWFRGYLKRSMEHVGMQKLESPLVNIAIRKNPPSVVIEDESLIPDTYKRIIPEQRVVDKEAIKIASKAGIGVAGTKIVQADRLEIK